MKMGNILEKFANWLSKPKNRLHIVLIPLIGLISCSMLTLFVLLFTSVVTGFLLKPFFLQIFLFFAICFAIVITIIFWSDVYRNRKN